MTCFSCTGRLTRIKFDNTCQRDWRSTYSTDKPGLASSLSGCRESVCDGHPTSPTFHVSPNSMFEPMSPSTENLAFGFSVSMQPTRLRCEERDSFFIFLTWMRVSRWNDKQIGFTTKVNAPIAASPPQTWNANFDRWAAHSKQHKERWFIG